MLMIEICEGVAVVVDVVVDDEICIMARESVCYIHFLSTNTSTSPTLSIRTGPRSRCN